MADCPGARYGRWMPLNALSYVASWPTELLRLTGKDRLDFIQRLSSGNLLPLSSPGLVGQTLFCTKEGKLVAWCQVLSEEDSLLLLPTPGGAPSLQAWLTRYLIMEEVTVAVEPVEQVAVAGPEAQAALGLDDGTRSAAGGWRCGPGGDGRWWADLFAYPGRLLGLVPVGAAARLRQAAAVIQVATYGAAEQEIFRLRAGVPKGPQEGEPAAPPLEQHLQQPRLGAISWTKGCYVGQEVISRLENYDKVGRWLMGVRSSGPLPAGVDVSAVRIVDALGAPLGRLTSWGENASAQAFLGLGLIKRSAARPQPALLVADGQRLPAQLELRPFFDHLGMPA
jgi:folate-binding protein YgfZ